MHGPAADSGRRCACGAQNFLGDTHCWLCFQRLEPANPPAVVLDDSIRPRGTADGESPFSTAQVVAPVSTMSPREPPDRAAAIAAGQFSLATAFLLISLSAVGLGLFVAVPGLAIALAIAAFPALMRTVFLVQRRAKSGIRVSPQSKIALFCCSLGVSVVVLIVVMVTAVGTFCAVCLSGGKDSYIPIALLCATIATLLVGFVLSKWIVYRWRRDIKRG
ncbi:MAG: hypothetical protein FJ295_10260 [Planctomycetes bacterium]|nr:hypothetical protein [Planctomycetota bacterium]